MTRSKVVVAGGGGLQAHQSNPSWVFPPIFTRMAGWCPVTRGRPHRLVDHVGRWLATPLAAHHLLVLEFVSQTALLTLVTCGTVACIIYTSHVIAVYIL